MRTRWLAVVSIAGLAGGIVVAQSTGGSRTPERVIQETRRLADEVAIARAIATAKLTPQQLEALLPVLEEGFANLDRGDQAAAEEIAALRQAIAEARRRALAGQEVPTEAIAQYESTIRGLAQNRDNYWRTFRDRVRALLQQLIAASQQADLINAARPAVLARRLGEFEPPLAPFWAQSEGDLRQRLLQAGFGERGRFGGRGGDDLTRLRSSPPQQYERERLRFALSSAGVPGWWAIPGIFGAGRGPAGAPGAPGGPPGGRGDRGGDQGGGPGGRFGRGDFQPPNLNDPQVQAQIRPFLQFADRVRAMPPAQFEAQRAQLTAQLESLRREARRQRESTREVTSEEAVNAFVDAYLLHPRSVAVIRERLGRATR